MSAWPFGKDFFVMIRSHVVRGNSMQAADQDYEKEKLNERIAKLSGGVAVIQVTSVPII